MYLHVFSKIQYVSSFLLLIVDRFRLNSTNRVADTWEIINDCNFCTRCWLSDENSYLYSHYGHEESSATHNQQEQFHCLKVILTGKDQEKKRYLKACVVLNAQYHTNNTTREDVAFSSLWRNCCGSVVLNYKVPLFEFSPMERRTSRCNTIHSPQINLRKS